MKKKRNHIRYLLSVMFLVLGLLALDGRTEAASLKTGKITAQTVSKKKKKSNKQKKKQQKEKAAEEETEQPESRADEETEQPEIYEDGEYTSREEVSLYLYTFGHLPDNYITKKEARELGWVSQEGNLWKVAPGKSIGGDYFGNYEELLPVKKGRSYYECDIDTDGHYRGAKRIIFSSDGWIYYTEDHYETFEELYSGDE